MARQLTLAINGWRLHALRTGIARYLVNILKHWKVGGGHTGFRSLRLYTAKKVDLTSLGIGDHIEQIVLPSEMPMLVWENSRLARRCREDILYCPSYSIPLLARCPSVVVIHDALLHLYPHLFPRRASVLHDRLYGWSGRHAALVITASAAGAEDIVRSYAIRPDRIRVIPLAPAEIFQHTGSPEARAEIRGTVFEADVPFFLFVGKISGRRNIPLFLESFARFKRETLFPHKLLIVGMNIHDLALAALIERLKISQHVVHRQRVTDEELAGLYNSAEALVSPSVYETVCLPVLEAQACGTPVICIDSAGMREQTGGAALFLKSLSVEELCQAMKTVAEDSSLRARLSSEGIENVKRFSWERSSLETLKVLEEAALM